MSERKYYCLCDSNCKFETMTKEQIIAAITQAMETGSVGNVDTGFVTKIKEMNRGEPLTFWVGTTAQYNALPEIVTGCMYIITDEKSAADLANWVEVNFVRKSEGGILREFDSGDIMSTEYTYSGNKAKLYTVLVNIDGIRGGASIVIDRAALSETPSSFYHDMGSASNSNYKVNVKAWLDDNGFPHFSIDHSMYRLRHVCGYC